MGVFLPIGGLKEKALAAHRAGVFEIIVPFENKKDLSEIPDHIRDQMTFHVVKRVGQALDLALAKKASKKKASGKKKTVAKKKSAKKTPVKKVTTKKVKRK